MKRTLALLGVTFVMSGSALACDLSRDECWQPKPRASEVRGWVRTSKPEPRVIIKRTVVINRVETPADQDDAQSGNCKPVVEALGEALHTWNNGRASARKAWMERVRWLHGERFMEHKLARGMSYQCNRVEVPGTEGVMGAAADERTHALKCEIRASPCAAPVVREDK